MIRLFVRESVREMSLRCPEIMCPPPPLYFFVQSIQKFRLRLVLLLARLQNGEAPAPELSRLNYL
jgi:hypothetical protein